jgi:hypothetical protein
LHKLEAGEDISSIIKFKEKIINREDTIETATVSFAASEEKKTESYIYEPIVFANDGLDVPSSDVLFKTGIIITENNWRAGFAEALIARKI